MQGKLTVKQLAEKVGLTPGRINQMIWNGDIEAESVGERLYLIDEKYVEIIINRPERRGRPKKAVKVVASRKHSST